MKHNTHPLKGVDRTKKFTISLSEDEYAELKDLARTEDRKIATLARVLMLAGLKIWRKKT